MLQNFTGCSPLGVSLAAGLAYAAVGLDRRRRSADQSARLRRARRARVGRQAL